VVSSLLTQIDDLPHYVVVIAASNHPELLDRAVWRRFELRISMETPSETEIVAWSKKFIHGLGNEVDNITFEYVVKRFYGQSYSEIKERILTAHRRFILNRPNNDFSFFLKKEVGKMP
jgi:AAA+ superfamily predicted ATPase